MIHFILYWVLLCANPKHHHNAGCYTVVAITMTADTGDETGNTPPNPPPPPPPPRP